jgi:ProP effector
MSSETGKPQTSPTIILRKKRPPTPPPQTNITTPEPPSPSFVRQPIAAPFSTQPQFRKTASSTVPVQRKAPPRGEAPPPRRGRPAPKRAAAPVKAPQPPPTLAPGQLNRRQRDAQAQQELLAQFRARWPQAFPLALHEIRPLARGVHQELATDFPNVKLSLIKQTIARFQRSYDGVYWRAILKGGSRYNLDGSPNGEVTAEEQEQARANLAALKARRTAVAPAPQTTGPPQTEAGSAAS